MKVSLCSPQLPQWAWRLAILVSPRYPPLVLDLHPSLC